MALKYYFVDENNSLVKVPFARMERLRNFDPNEKYPEYAGKKVKKVEVLVAYENKRPVNIVRTWGTYAVFNMDGSLSKEYLNERMRDVASSFSITGQPKREGNLIDAKQKFNKKVYQSKHVWDIPADIMDKVYTDIFQLQQNYQ